MIEREKGPVEILCKEIGFPFDIRMERPEIFVSFIMVLVERIAEMRSTAFQISQMGYGLPAPSAESGYLLEKVFKVLGEKSPMGSQNFEVMRTKASKLGWRADQPEDGPCDHLVDMLGSCISAITFGLEKPCRSRHAADAATHIWRKLYSIGREDEISRPWIKEFARAQLQEAILRLALEKINGAP